MTKDPFRIKRVMTKLERAWHAAPDMTLGQIIEQVEDIAWERYTALSQRSASARLMNLDDAALEWALNEWLKGRGVTERVGWLS